MFNTQLKNQAKQYSFENRNQKRALTQANLDSLLRGYMGNRTQKDLQELDTQKAYIQAIASGNTGVAERLYDILPPKIKKNIYGNYRPAFKK
jgi:hypothetical protein